MKTRMLVVAAVYADAVRDTKHRKYMKGLLFILDTGMPGDSDLEVLTVR